MKTLCLVFLFTAGICFSQTFRAARVNGDVKIQIGTNEKWLPVGPNQELAANSVVSTGKNSSILIDGSKSKVALKSFSALPLSSIKKMTVNDLVLALAMEDLLNAPRKKENQTTRNTAVYGAEVNGVQTPVVESDNFGIKRLNGAVQLAQNGYKESAEVVAKETFRKYPETNNIPSFRIYFADILFDLGLNEDAYDDFKSIQQLNLKDNEKSEVSAKLDVLAKRLLKN